MKKIIEALLIIVVLFFGVCIFLLSNHIGGFRAFVVMSSSMEPAISTGSLVITQQVQPKNLRKGDVITFIPPSKNRDYITHRITRASENGTLTLFKTKGDKNKAEDGWVLAGGGVVGKVIYQVPQLGYLLSLSKTKIGIVIFILVPALIIFYLEITEVYGLLKTKKKKTESTSQAKILTALFFIVLFPLFSPKSTHALISDKVSLRNNTFTVEISTDSNNCSQGFTKINISGNGIGSNNNASVFSNCSVNISQLNNTTVTTNVSTNVSTGGNTVSGNTGANTSIVTGDANITVNISASESSNIVNITPRP